MKTTINYAVIPGIKEVKIHRSGKETFEIIQGITAEYFNVEISDLFTSCRKRELIEVKHLVKHFMKKYCTNLPLNKIGAFYHQDHATVIHSLKFVKNYSEVSKEYRETVYTIELKIIEALKCLKEVKNLPLLN
jgi:chromosomal replication initiation ATPase DnaA